VNWQLKDRRLPIELNKKLSRGTKFNGFHYVLAFFSAFWSTKIGEKDKSLLNFLRVCVFVKASMYNCKKGATVKLGYNQQPGQIELAWRV